MRPDPGTQEASEASHTIEEKGWGQEDGSSRALEAIACLRRVMLSIPPHREPGGRPKGWLKMQPSLSSVNVIHAPNIPTLSIVLQHLDELDGIISRYRDFWRVQAELFSSQRITSTCRSGLKSTSGSEDQIEEVITAWNRVYDAQGEMVSCRMRACRTLFSGPPAVSIPSPHAWVNC